MSWIVDLITKLCTTKHVVYKNRSQKTIANCTDIYPHEGENAKNQKSNSTKVELFGRFPSDVHMFVTSQTYGVSKNGLGQILYFV